MTQQSFDNQFLFVGNYLCLDFINTEMVLGGQPVDLLVSFQRLMSWLAEAGTLEERQAEQILESWEGSRQAEKTFQSALALRSDLREMTERLAKGRAVPQSALQTINEWLPCQTGHAEVKRTRGGFQKHFQADFREPIHAVWPVAESAADMLCYADLALVKKCENPACVLFFYDTSKNHSRRWCSMSACGNRMKVAAHYQRLRNAK